MLQTITNFMPRPIKDIVLAPLNAKKNPDLAAERLIKSSIRISIAAIGIFFAYKFGNLNKSLQGIVASYALSFAVVSISSFPAGTIMWGFAFSTVGALELITALGLKSLNLYSLSLHLFRAGFGMGMISVGLLAIQESEPQGGFSGLLEPYINHIAEKYRASTANFLRNFS